MDLQDLQDDRRSDVQYGEITEKIIGCAFEVINELGTGFLESVFEKAMASCAQRLSAIDEQTPRRDTHQRGG